MKSILAGIMILFAFRVNAQEIGDILEKTIRKTVIGFDKDSTMVKLRNSITALIE